MESLGCVQRSERLKWKSHQFSQEVANMRTKAFFLGLAIVLLSSTLSSQWVQTNGPNGGTTICFVVYGSSLYAGTEGGGVYRSTDNGSSWSTANTGLTDTTVNALVVCGTSLFAGTGSNGVFRTTDSGMNWVPVNSGLTNAYVSSFAALGEYLFVGTGGGVFVSSNHGAHWISANTGLTSTYALSLAALGTDLFAAGGIGSSSGVFRSTDLGASWSTAHRPVRDAFSFVAATDNDLFAVCGWGGLERSTNRGASWEHVGPSITVSALVASFMSLFVGTYYGGIHRSCDDGASWSEVNERWPISKVDSSLYLPAYCLAIAGQYLFAGTEAGVWRRPLSEMTTSIGEPLWEEPTKFTLEQNYPNPFNPTTAVSWQQPAVSWVRLVVYDLLGREVKVLMDERKEPGRYQVEFDGAKLSSGVYICRMTTGEFVESKRMLLMR
jgi:photosystem II stability/assembly factor-like uncharacterized protein